MDEKVFKWFEIHCDYSTINDKYLVYTISQSKCAISVFDLTGKICEPLVIHGHMRQINGFAISQKQSPCWLASFGLDCVKLWNLDLAIDCHGAGDSFQGVNLCPESIGYINHACFSPECDYVVCCVGPLIKVFSTQTEDSSLTMILEGHNADVTFCEFVGNPECPSEELLVSLSDDRTFKIWKLEEQCLLYQSQILSPKYLSTFACHPDENILLIADLAGKLYVIDMTQPNRCRESYKVDLLNLSNKKASSSVTIDSPNLQSDKRLTGPITISSRPSWQTQNPSVNASIPDFAESEEFSVGVLAVHYLSWWSPTDKESSVLGLGGVDQAFAMSELRESLSCNVYLLIATYSELIILNARTYEHSAAWSYKKDFNLSHPVSSAFITSDSTYQVLLCLKDYATSQLSLIIIKSILDHIKTDYSSDSISFLSRSSLLADSILNSGYTNPDSNKSNNKTHLRKQSLNKPLKRGSLSDQQQQPLTFKTKIQSSGYANVDKKREMFKPQLAQNKKSIRKPSSNCGALKSFTESSYPLDYEIPTIRQKSLKLDVNSVVVNRMSFSGSGGVLACALSNNSCQLLAASSLKPRSSLTGHNGRVTWCAWSADNNWVITSSEDKTARIWSFQTGESVHVINTRECKSKDSSIPVKNKILSSELKSVSFAQFYYLDRFFYLICDHELLLYKYHTDMTKQDVKRYQSNSKYKTVKSYSLAESNRLTCASSVNRFYSNYIVCGGSCKSVSVLDLNSGQFIINNTDAHTRPVTSIAINQGSNFSTLGGRVYDLYATSAIGDSIKLWDLRTNKSVQRYSNHVNRLVPINIEFSPCGRYLGTGSEDRSAYIYDIRSSNSSIKISGLSDTATSVIFHPAKPSIYTGCSDGNLSVFSQDVNA